MLLEVLGVTFSGVGKELESLTNGLVNLKSLPRKNAKAVNWGGAGNEPGIGWSRDQQTPENLGGDRLVMTRLCVMLISTGFALG